MPKPGDIICYEKFEFEDGTKKDKLFVVLNDVDTDIPCLVLKTTSQSERYSGVKQGCNIAKKVFFIPTTWQKCFTLDTYIQLPPIIEFSLTDLLKGSLANKKISVTSSISSDCLVQLKNCLKKFKDYVSERHWELIFHS